MPTLDWWQLSLTYPGINLINMTPEIAVEAAHLPGQFHRDPGDRLLVATSRILGYPILTADARILAYKHVAKA